MKKTLLAFSFLTLITLHAKSEGVNPVTSNGSNLENFQGNLNNNKVTLQWTVTKNEISDKFEVERSTNGTEFSTAALVFGTEKTGTDYYPYFETAKAEKLFYRLKITDKNKIVSYSNILVFQNNTFPYCDVKIIGNPAKDMLTLNFQSTADQVINISVTDIAGRQVIQQKINSHKGDNLATLPVPTTLNKGMYVMDLFDGVQHRTTKFVKN
jgi:hypothetical protein